VEVEQARYGVMLAAADPVRLSLAGNAKVDQDGRVLLGVYGISDRHVTSIVRLLRDKDGQITADRWRSFFKTGSTKAEREHHRLRFDPKAVSNEEVWLEGDSWIEGVRPRPSSEPVDADFITRLPWPSRRPDAASPSWYGRVRANPEAVPPAIEGMPTEVVRELLQQTVWSEVLHDPGRFDPENLDL